MRKFIIFILMLFFIGCSEQKEIKIAANKWIGYAPLFYADSTGCLRKNNFKLIQTISLDESLGLYKDRLVDAFAGTQVEFNKANDKNLVAVAWLDKSDGADMAYSNLTLNQLKHQKNIHVYLEVDTVNCVLFDYLKDELKHKKFFIHNLDQLEISKIKLKKPFIIVTYAPYDLIYKKRGYKLIISSKDPEIYIIDALFTNKNFYKKHKKEFQNLNLCIKEAEKKLKNDPKNFFNKIKNYFPNYSYKNFLSDLKGVKWITTQDIKNKRTGLRYIDENN